MSSELKIERQNFVNILSKAIKNYWDQTVGQGGSYVIDGAWAFKIRDTYGVPLEIIALELKDENCVIDWEGYVIEAVKANWLISKIKSDMLEVLPKEVEISIDALIMRVFNGRSN